MSQNTAGVASRLSEGERRFVDQVADYYYFNDGMPRERGQVLGWLMISDPPEQTADQIADTLGVSRDDVDRMIAQLVPSTEHQGGVFQRTDLPGGGYSVRMLEGRWANQIKAVFAGIPDFHQVTAYGLEVLDGASPERRRRLVLMERFLRYLTEEFPAMWERYERTRGNGAK